jgi:hypothetical protein
VQIDLDALPDGIFKVLAGTHASQFRIAGPQRTNQFALLRNHLRTVTTNLSMAGGASGKFNFVKESGHNFVFQ